MLLGLYLALLVVALEIAASSRDLFGSLIVAGVMSMWTFQILINIGMTIGLMPITGIPLPFMSFGSARSWSPTWRQRVCCCPYGLADAASRDVNEKTRVAGSRRRV